MDGPIMKAPQLQQTQQEVHEHEESQPGCSSRHDPSSWLLADNGATQISSSLSRHGTSNRGSRATSNVGDLHATLNTLRTAGAATTQRQRGRQPSSYSTVSAQQQQQSATQQEQPFAHQPYTPMGLRRPYHAATLASTARVRPPAPRTMLPPRRGRSFSPEGNDITATTVSVTATISRPGMHRSPKQPQVSVGPDADADEAPTHDLCANERMLHGVVPSHPAASEQQEPGDVAALNQSPDAGNSAEAEADPELSAESSSRSSLAGSRVADTQEPLQQASQNQQAAVQLHSATSVPTPPSTPRAGPHFERVLSRSISAPGDPIILPPKADSSPSGTSPPSSNLHRTSPNSYFLRASLARSSVAATATATTASTASTSKQQPLRADTPSSMLSSEPNTSSRCSSPVNPDDAPRSLRTPHFADATANSSDPVEPAPSAAMLGFLPEVFPTRFAFIFLPPPSNPAASRERSLRCAQHRAELEGRASSARPLQRFASVQDALLKTPMDAHLGSCGSLLSESAIRRGRGVATADAAQAVAQPQAHRRRPERSASCDSPRLVAPMRRWSRSVSSREASSQATREKVVETKEESGCQDASPSDSIVSTPRQGPAVPALLSPRQQVSAAATVVTATDSGASDMPGSWQRPAPRPLRRSTSAPTRKTLANHIKTCLKQLREGDTSWAPSVPQPYL